MENILYNISQVLGITIIHSLWQGLLIYFVLKLVLLAAGDLTSARKYKLAVASLFAITAWFAYTLINEIQLYTWVAQPQAFANTPLAFELPANIRQIKDQTVRYYYSIEQYLPYITVLYLAGLLLNTAKIIWVRKKINAIKQTMSIDVPLQQKISRFAKKLDIGKKVKVGLSSLVDVPCIVGYFKPVILLPFTLSSYLSAEEIEAILMHELAHIKRNDYLINVAQQVITALLFFNPCVILINKIIGEERENSCDDLVVHATQNPMIYAKALFKLEQTRQNQLQLALAVTGKKYHLLNRIERIMKTKKQTLSIRPTLVAMLILTVSVGGLALLNPQIAEGKISVKAVKPGIENLLTDTIRKKAAKTKVVRANNGKVKEVRISRYNVDGRNVYYNVGMEDARLEKLTAEVDRHANVIGKYYESDKFKAYSADIEKRGKEIEAFYNSDKMKAITQNQEKMGKEFEQKWGGDNSAMKQTGAQMEQLGKQIEAYFNTPEFKEMNARLEKKYGLSHNGYHDSRDENYRKYQDELNKNLSPQIKEQTAKIKQLGEQMRNVFGADMRKDGDRMRAMGDSMRRAFNNPEIKKQQNEMRLMGDKMRAYAESPEMAKQKDELRKATDKLRAYTNSPEFKAKVKEWKKTYKTYRWDNDDEVHEIPAPPAPADVREVPVPAAPPAVHEVPVKP